MRPLVALIISFCLLAAAVPTAAAGAPARDLHQKAVQALSHGQVDEAVRLLTEAIAKEPGEPRYFNDRGVALRRAGKLENALEDYTKALSLKPDWVTALNNRGVALMELGRSEDAVKDYDEALKQSEMKSRLYTNRGAAYARLGRHERAIEDFKEAVSQRPLDFRSFVLMAQSLEHLGEREKAVSMYRLAQAVVRDPDLLDVVDNRIAELEGVPNQGSSGAGTPTGIKTRPRSVEKSPAPSRSAGPSQVAPQSVGAGPSVEKSPVPPYGSPETIDALLEVCRKRAVATFSADAAQTYREAREFSSAGDVGKAILRHEDALQFSKRNRNSHGEAWNLFEIGKLHSRAGEHLKALPCFDQALRLFERIRAKEETILALVAMAEAVGTPGGSQKAAEYYSKAAEIAVSRGNHKLAQAVEGMKHRKPTPQAAGRQSPKPPDVAKEAKKPLPDQMDRPQSDGGSQRKAMNESVKRLLTDQPGKPTQEKTVPKIEHPVHPGPGPADNEVRGKNVPAVGFVPPLSTKTIALEKPQPVQAAHPGQQVAVREEPRPGSEIHPFKDRKTQSEPRTADEYIALLGQLKEKGDETGMIPVLERLAERLERDRRPDKVLPCLVAAAALREKHGLLIGADAIFFKLGEVRGARGEPAKGLEDIAHGLALMRESAQPKVKDAQMARAATITKKLRLDSKSALTALESFWTARLAGDQQQEALALVRIGGLYEKAGQASAASDYYARSAAALLSRSERLLRTAGEDGEATKALSEAISALRSHDDNRRQVELKSSRRTGKLSGRR